MGDRIRSAGLVLLLLCLFVRDLPAQALNFDEGLNRRGEAVEGEGGDETLRSGSLPSWPVDEPLVFAKLASVGFEGLRGETLSAFGELSLPFKAQILRDLQRLASEEGGPFWSSVQEQLDGELGPLWRRSRGLLGDSRQVEAAFARVLSWAASALPRDGSPAAELAPVSAPPSERDLDGERSVFRERQRDLDLALQRLDWAAEDDRRSVDEAWAVVGKLLDGFTSHALCSPEDGAALQEERLGLRRDLDAHLALRAFRPSPWRFWEGFGLDERKAAARRTFTAAVSRLRESLRSTEPLPPKRVEPPSVVSEPSEGFRNFDFFQNRPPESKGLDEALIRFLAMARPGSRLSAGFYQVDRRKVCQAFADCAERIGADSIRFVTDDHYFEDENASYSGAYAILREAGIVVRDETWKGGSGAGQCHNKCAVVNGEWLWTGSYNITDNGTSKNPNHALVLRSRLLAEAYEAEIDQMWAQGLFGRQKQSLGRRLFVVDGRGVELYFSPQDETNREILTEIASAEHRCWVAMFSLTDLMLVRALARRARAGVDVRVYMDNLGASFTMAYDPASSAKIKVRDYLAAAGVRVGVESSGAMMHHKFAVIDGNSDSDPVVITGSHNWSGGADTKNDENTLILHAPDLARRFEALFLELSGEEAGTMAPAVPAGFWKGRVLLSRVCFSGGTHEDFVEIACVEGGPDGVVDLSGFSLQSDGKALFVFPEGLSVKLGERVLVAQGESTPPFPAVARYPGIKLSLTNTDENMNLVDRGGFVRDAVVWANGDGRFLRGEEEDLRELVAEGQWRRDASLPLDESLAVAGDRVARNEYLERRDLVDTDTALDWEVRKLP